MGIGAGRHGSASVGIDGVAIVVAIEARMFPT